MSRMDILVEAYSNIKEMPETIRTTADMVPVIESQGVYVTETNYLVPFMRENGIETVEEALDKIAEANNLEPKQVGLLVAAQNGIDTIAEAGIDEASEEKLEGFLRMADRLLEGGYPVFKKISEAAHAEGCKCELCQRKREKEECGDGNCETPKKECGGSCNSKKECGDGSSSSSGDDMSAGSFNGEV